MDRKKIESQGSTHQNADVVVVVREVPSGGCLVAGGCLRTYVDVLFLRTVQLGDIVRLTTLETGRGVGVASLCIYLATHPSSIKIGDRTTPQDAVLVRKGKETINGRSDESCRG